MVWSRRSSSLATLWWNPNSSSSSAKRLPRNNLFASNDCWKGIALVLVTVTIGWWLRHSSSLNERSIPGNDDEDDDSVDEKDLRSNQDTHPSFQASQRQKPNSRSSWSWLSLPSWFRSSDRTTTASNNPKNTTTEKNKNKSCTRNRQIGSDISSSQSPPPHLQLPSHLERQLAKDRRRIELQSVFSMKKPMYDNIFMYDPQGTLLCTISLKKATWYVDTKHLAVWLDEPPPNPNHHTTNSEHDVTNKNNKDKTIQTNHNTTKKKKKYIQLLFQPNTNKHQAASSSSSSSSSSQDHNTTTMKSYNQSAKMNQCVICGSTEHYMRHYVVPYCYRTLFPAQYKTHVPHDVVLVCAAHCRVPVEQATQERKKHLEQRLRQQHEQRERERKQGHGTMHINTSFPYLIDKERQSIASSAQALLKWKHQLPRSRQVEYGQRLHEWIKKTQPPQIQSPESAPGNDTNETTDSVHHLLNDTVVLQELSQLEFRRPNPHYISGPELVHRWLFRRESSSSATTTTQDEDNHHHHLDHDRIAGFIRDWRQHFCETHHPRYLPKGWSVESPVMCDSRGKDNNNNKDANHKD